MPDLDDVFLALRVVVSLAAVLGVVWLLQRRIARGASKQRSADTIRVVAKRGIGPKAQLVVVEVDDQRYVLGVTEAGVSMLDRTGPEPVEPAAPEPAAFPTILADAAGAARPAARPASGSRPADDDAPLLPPLPLRRSQPRATASRTMTARDAATVLRRALGA